MLSADDWSPRRWRVGLLAHEAKRESLVAFVQRHRARFRDWELLATTSIAAGLRDAPGLRLRTVPPGSREGEARMKTEIAGGEIDALIFLRDPLTTRPDEEDTAALLHVADVRNVPVATNLASAECIVRALSPEAAVRVR
jgi:methylglyoxal synthase